MNSLSFWIELSKIKIGELELVEIPEFEAFLCTQTTIDLLKNAKVSMNTNILQTTCFRTNLQNSFGINAVYTIFVITNSKWYTTFLIFKSQYDPLYSSKTKLIKVKVRQRVVVLRVDTAVKFYVIKPESVVLLRGDTAVQFHVTHQRVC